MLNFGGVIFRISCARVIFQVPAVTLPQIQVVEFEDLLRPNEAMALLEAARVTAERRLV